MRFVTRKNAAVDRIACPWLIRRHIDKDAEFLYVEPQEVARVASDRAARPQGAVSRRSAVTRVRAATLRSLDVSFRPGRGEPAGTAPSAPASPGGPW